MMGPKSDRMEYTMSESSRVGPHKRAIEESDVSDGVDSRPSRRQRLSNVYARQNEQQEDEVFHTQHLQELRAMVNALHEKEAARQQEDADRAAAEVSAAEAAAAVQQTSILPRRPGISEVPGPYMLSRSREQAAKLAQLKAEMIQLKAELDQEQHKPTLEQLARIDAENALCEERAARINAERERDEAIAAQAEIEVMLEEAIEEKKAAELMFLAMTHVAQNLAEAGPGTPVGEEVVEEVGLSSSEEEAPEEMVEQQAPMLAQEVAFTGNMNLANEVAPAAPPALDGLANEAQPAHSAQLADEVADILLQLQEPTDEPTAPEITTVTNETGDEPQAYDEWMDAPGQALITDTVVEEIEGPWILWGPEIILNPAAAQEGAQEGAAEEVLDVAVEVDFLFDD